MLESPQQFDDKKRKFFAHIALRVREALQLHKRAGLWERTEGKREWRNVTEHCLVEIARLEVLADMLDLPADVKKEAATATVLHDFFKKREGGMSAQMPTWSDFEKASEEARHQMQEAGFNENTVRMASSMGHSSLIETERILNKGSLSPEDTAYLLIHYVDDYTMGSDWTKPAEILPDGSAVNDLDRRVLKNENNQRYTRLNEDGRDYFAGETTFSAQRRIGHLVEERLAKLVAEKSARGVDARDLPQFTDREIHTRIMR